MQRTLATSDTWSFGGLGSSTRARETSCHGLISRITERLRGLAARAIVTTLQDQRLRLVAFVDNRGEAIRVAHMLEPGISPLSSVVRGGYLAKIPGCPPVTTGAWFAAAVASCSPGIPSSPAHAGTRRLGARGARPAPAPCPPHIPPSTHPSAGPPRLTLAHARKSRFVSNARQFSMARYLSSHPDRRITASTTCRSRPVQCPGPGARAIALRVATARALRSRGCLRPPRLLLLRTCFGPRFPDFRVMRSRGEQSQFYKFFSGTVPTNSGGFGERRRKHCLPNLSGRYHVLLSALQI